MSTFADDMSALAVELIDEFGETVLIEWPSGLPAPWTGKAALLPVSRRYVDGVAVLASDRVAWVAHAGPPMLSASPQATGLLTAASGSESMRIVDVQEFGAQGIPVAYALLLRGIA